MSSVEQLRRSDNGGGAVMRQLVLAHLRQEGMAAAQAGHLEQAHAYLQQALTLDSEDADLWTLLGTVVSDTKVQAICARQALELSPEHPQARSLLQEIADAQNKAPSPQPEPTPQDDPATAPPKAEPEGSGPAGPAEDAFRLALPRLRPRPRPRTRPQAVSFHNVGGIRDPSDRRACPSSLGRSRSKRVYPIDRPWSRAIAATQPSALLHRFGEWLSHQDTPLGRARFLATTILLFVLVFNLTLGQAYARRYQDQIIPGVHVAGLDVGGLSPAKVHDILQGQVDQALEQAIVLRYGNRTWRFSAAEIGLNYRIDESCQQAWALSRQDSSGQRLSAVHTWWDRGRIGLWGEQVPLMAEVYTSRLQMTLDTMATELDQPAIMANVAWQEDGWVISAGQDGRQILQQDLRQRLMTALAAIVHGETPLMGRPLYIDVPTITETAALSAAQVAQLQGQLDQVGRPLELHCAEHTWTLGPTEIATLIRVESAPAPERFSIQLDRAAIQRYLETLAPDVAQAALAPSLQMEGERVVAFNFGRDGRILDLEPAVQQLEGALQRQLQGEPVGLVELPIEVLPAGDDALMAEMGIQGLVGEGTSTFVDSPADRNTNILVGGQELHGRLIDPGETFSLNDVLDPITWEKGYRLSGIIVGGSVVMGLGGGLCQVATTLYRTALYSGLEIVERHPHAWRIDWYEQDAPPGFDATIALGGPDLKFRNNTGHSLLIQVDTRLDLSRQTIRFYGTPPGWEVSIDNLYIGDNGHSASFRRTVTRDGEIVLQETFYSYYQ